MKSLVFVCVHLRDGVRGDFGVWSGILPGFGKGLGFDPGKINRSRSGYSGKIRCTADAFITQCHRIMASNFPEKRLTLGKPEAGLLGALEAVHRSGMLLITVSDDG